jgi:hypothetical protein
MGLDAFTHDALVANQRRISTGARIVQVKVVCRQRGVSPGTLAMPITNAGPGLGGGLGGSAFSSAIEGRSCSYGTDARLSLDRRKHCRRIKTFSLVKGNGRTQFFFVAWWGEYWRRVMVVSRSK